MSIENILCDVPAWPFGKGWELSCSGHGNGIEQRLIGLDYCAKAEAIRLISDDHTRVRVARAVFGPKTAGDLGLVSTMDHPKTDYGEPRLGGAWDLDLK